MTNPPTSETKSVELLGCPFCGARPAHDHTRTDGVRFSCLECDEAAFEDFDEAAQHWNHRASPSPDKDAEIARLRAALAGIIKCDDDARSALQNGAGLLDCIDNAGRFYPSQHLDDCLRRARQALGGSHGR